MYYVFVESFGGSIWADKTLHSRSLVLFRNYIFESLNIILLRLVSLFTSFIRPAAPNMPSYPLFLLGSFAGLRPTSPQKKERVCKSYVT